MQPTLNFEPVSPLEAAFAKYHRENPHVYELICRYADEAIAVGRRHLSMKLLFERIRWYTQIETTGDELKLNNNFTACYARLWLRRHPGFPDFFETRESPARSEGRVA